MEAALTGLEQRWDIVKADEGGDVLVQALAMGGVEYLFFTSGSELVTLQEGIAKANALGRKAPRLITVTHEGVNLSAALGYALVSEKPAATVVHVDVGTLNYGAQLHTALRASLPVLIMAGAPPTSYPGQYRGGRDGGHFWLQQVPDQNGIVRQYVKWDHRLEWQDNPGLTVSRALQVARSEPAGPVYLSLPREVTMRKVNGTASFPAVDELCIASAPCMSREVAKEVIRRLLSAVNPVVVTSRLGRSKRATRLLEQLTMVAGMAVTDGAWRAYQAIPLDSPLYQRDLDLSEADFVLVIEADAPWVPGPRAPLANACVIVVDADPVRTNIPTFEFVADMRITASAEPALEELIEVFEACATPQQLAAAAGRFRSWQTRSELKRASLRAQAEVLAERSSMIQPRFLCQCIADAMDENCLVLDETLGAAPVYQYLKMSGAGTYYRNPSSGGGWGPGAAFGAKLASPGKDVVLTTGDGFYMYGVPTAALWAANHYKAPFLAIVFQNRSYNTGTSDVSLSYPGGFAARAGFEGGYFDPPIDFALEAQAAGAYGENVRESAQVMAALQRGLSAVRAGQCAVLSFWLPRLEQET